MYGEQNIYLFSFHAHTELHLIDLLEELYPVCTSWYNIGLKLQIPVSTLDRFKQMYTDPLELMREMLKHWLQTAVDPCPTWKDVVTALKSPIVNKITIAAQLESKYCAPEQHSNRPTQGDGSEGTYIHVRSLSYFTGVRTFLGLV